MKSPADWISPNPEGGYKDDPPAANGTKVIISDTDHLWGEGGDHQWVWKSFLRGLNPIFMDRFAALTGNDEGDIPGAEAIRRALGVTRALSERMNLAAMIPRDDLSSTHYCLANPGREYLTYLPAGGTVTLDLTAATGKLSGEWVDPVTGKLDPIEAVEDGGKRDFKSPLNGDAALYLRRNH